MVCLRGEVLILLVSVRLAAVASLSPVRLAGWQNLNSFACEACLCSRVLVLPLRLVCVVEFEVVLPVGTA